MPKQGSTAELVAAERLLDEKTRYKDLAVRLRVLRPDGEPGELRPEIIGARWDTWSCRWARRRPKNLKWTEWTVQKQQLPIIFDCPPEIGLVAIFAGVQAGKTSAGLMQIGFDAIRWPGRETYIISLDYKASREPQEAFGALLPPDWGVEWIATDRWYLFPNSHRVIFRSEENIKSIRGGAPKALLVDEAAYMAYASYIAAIGRGVASKDFRLYLTTTPKRETEWIREVNETWGKDGQSKIFRLRSDDNPRANKPYLAWLRGNLPADIVSQELDGKITPPLNAAYAALFRRGLHIRPPGNLPDPVRFLLERNEQGRVRDPRDFTAEYCRREYDAEADFLAGWDLQKEAAVIAQLYRDTRIETIKGRRRRVVTLRLWIVGVEVNLHSTTDQHARTVTKKWGRRIALITDAMGQHPRAGGRGTEERSGHEILRQHGFAYVGPVAKANPPVDNRQRTLSRALRSGLEVFAPNGENVWRYRDDDGHELEGGEVLVFIAPAGTVVEVQRPNGATAKVITDGCQLLVDALENQKMKHGKPEKDGKYEHVNDALGYLVYSVLPIENGPVEGFEYPGRVADEIED